MPHTNPDRSRLTACAVYCSQAPVVLRKLGMIGAADPRATLGNVLGSTLGFIQEAFAGFVGMGAGGHDEAAPAPTVL